MRQAVGQALKLMLVAGLLGPLCLRCTSPRSPDPLVRFESCEELEAFVEDRLLHPQRTGDDVVGCAEPLDGFNRGAPEFTTTLTQELDVDEPDFVKNDGDHIFVLRRGQMIIVDAWPADAAAVVSQTAISGVPFALFLDDDRALVLSRVVERGARATVAGIFDIADRAAPRLVREVRINAEFVDARRVGDDVEVISRSVVGAGVTLRTDAFRDDENRALLRAAGIDGLFPVARDRDVVAGREQVARAVECEDVWAPRHTSAIDVVVVQNIPLRQDARPLAATAVVGNAEHVYASRGNVYVVGAERYDGGPFTPAFAVTRVHQFGTFDGTEMPYRGSAVVDGDVKDELSLDEDSATGALRVVVTNNDDGNGDVQANTTSLVVLREGDDFQLDEVGRVDDLGNGEVVEAVRFVDHRAYVGTANVDTGATTLVAVDVKEPQAPRRLGALSLSGHLGFLQAVDDSHVVVVGAAVDSGVFAGLKLQLIDVSDPRALRLTHETSFGDANGGSEALVDRHALTWFASHQTLALPYQHVRDANDTSEAIVDESALAVFHVDIDAGFTERGLVTQMPLYSSALAPLRASTAVCAAVRRSVILADDADGAFVYAVSTGGITVADLDDGSVVGNVVFGGSDEAACAAEGEPL